MKIHKILALSLVLSICLSVAGCSNKVDAKNNNIKDINITYVKAPLNVPSILEKQKNSFKSEFSKDNIEVKFHDLTSGPQQTQALAAGELQFLHALGGTSAILAASNGVDLKILNIYSRAPKAFMILTKNKDIKSAKDLKGKNVAGPKGTVLHQLLLAALDENDLKGSDVKFINMGIPQALAALNNSSVDAALLAGPAALKAIKSGAKLVTNGEGLVEGTIVTAVSDKFFKDHPDLVERFKKVHKETLKFMKENRKEAIKIAAKEVGLTEKETEEMFNWYDFNMDVSRKDIKELSKTQDFLINNHMQKNKINVEYLIAK
ncbi:ABC transporter substrate-binding protein [Hathewaya limosa]|uniref:Sulfonate transport system substrate-binding protein n=1 Tax=Hathewaya limosa TaxID=1536 RepID=A0ABU0JV11_HATLI|nr:NrtA/SsuA/CpmA family ABC transporter substrate-binding protein [Hathewaya limosa]MDQ0480951.1 sulfonate transport system substrate-binding protein [Hathewaya limosa]